MITKQNEALKSLKKAVNDEFSPEKVWDIIVFGSVARGTDTSASDIDVIVILDLGENKIDWHIEKKVRDVAFNIELEYDVVFDLKMLGRASLRRPEGHTPFLEKAMSEGISA